MASQDGRGFIEDQDPGLVDQCFRNLDDLALGNAEIPNPVPHIQRDTEASQHGLSISIQLPPVDGTAPGEWIAAEENVLRSAQVGSKVELLVDGADALLDRVLGLPERHRVTQVQHRPGVRTYRAGQDLDQRRFPSAVFAHQGVYLSLLDPEGDLLKGSNAGKAFRDTVELKNRHQALAGTPLGVPAPTFTG